MDQGRLVEELFALSNDVRCVAVRIGGGGGALLSERAGLVDASDDLGESTTVDALLG